jgi:flagellar motor switch protein FliM
MAKILSQEEVDALLSEFSGEEGVLPAVAAAQPVNVSLYDFRRPDRVSKEELRSLYYLHDRFARNFSSTLSAYLRCLTDVNLYSVEQITYDEFILSLPDPTYYNTVSMYPLEGSAVLEINPGILFPMIDKILGGKGESYGGAMRTITDIERTLIEGVVDLILKDLEETWNQIFKLKMAVTAVETSPQLLQVVAPNEIVVLIVFELKLGEAKGFMNFCIPAVVLEPIVKRFSRDGYADRVKTSVEELKKITLNLLRTKVNLEAGIYDNTITVKELMAVKAGDVIRLKAKVSDEIYIKVNGIKKYSASQVRKDSQKAVQIVSLIPREFKNE